MRRSGLSRTTAERKAKQEPSPRSKRLIRTLVVKGVEYRMVTLPKQGGGRHRRYFRTEDVLAKETGRTPEPGYGLTRHHRSATHRVTESRGALETVRQDDRRGRAILRRAPRADQK